MIREIAELIIMLCVFSPFLYGAYLFFLDPWSDEKKETMLHELAGNEILDSDDGVMAYNSEDARIYFHK